jgi:hypothetical protein
MLLSRFVMTYILIALPVWSLCIWLFVRLERTRRKKYSPVKAVCGHCYELHDGPLVFCDACEWACFPDGLVQEEIREQVDSIQYRTSGIDGKGEQ